MRRHELEGIEGRLSRLGPHKSFGTRIRYAGPKTTLESRIVVTGVDGAVDTRTIGTLEGRLDLDHVANAQMW